MTIFGGVARATMPRLAGAPAARRGSRGVHELGRSRACMTRAAPSARGRGVAPRTSSLHPVSLGLIEHGLGTWNDPRHPGHALRASPSSEPLGRPPAPELRSLR